MLKKTRKFCGLMVVAAAAVFAAVTLAFAASDGAGDMTNRLLTAIKANSLKDVKRIVQEGANVNAANIADYSATPLMYAAKHGYNQGIPQFLIEKGANVNAANELGWTPLIYAAADNNNPEVVRLLLKKGAEVNAADIDGVTSLMYAASDNSNPA